MYINEKYEAPELTEETASRCIFRDGKISSQPEALLREHVIDVYVNDTLTMKLICIPQYLSELVLGRLFTEGLIDGVQDVELLYICEYGKRAKVLLKNRGNSRREEFVETTPSCCTGNRVLNDYFVKHRELTSVRPIPWKASWIFRLADEFAKDTPLHEKTMATHSCFLAREGEVLFSCEDIGRHNALDKVIGYALRNGIDLSGCILYTSGRIPTDMAVKAIQAKIPVLAGKAAVSQEAVLLAREYQLTLIGFAKTGRMKQFAGEAPVQE